MFLDEDFKGMLQNIHIKYSITEENSHFNVDLNAAWAGPYFSFRGQPTL
jgi:hypothetical protein